MRIMSDTKKNNPNEKPQNHPVRVFRVGAVAASIWRRQTPTGFEYLDFSLSRSWKLKSGEREGYSQNFFETNEEALFDVIQQASRFIREQQSERAELPRIDHEPQSTSHVAASAWVDPA